MPSLDAYTGLVTSQHAGRPKFMAMVAALAQCFVDQQAFLEAMPAAFDLDTAIGVQLDAVGLWVGLSRRIAVPIPGAYFSFDTVGLGWESGVWFRPGDDVTAVSVLDDDTYRTLLRAKIGANNWDGSNEHSVAILNYIFHPIGLIPTLKDNQDMSMKITLEGESISALLQAVITQGYVPVRPVGVSVSFEYDITNATVLDDASATCAVVFTDGNLTITYINGATGPNTVTATNPKVFGKPYWEILATSSDSSIPIWGCGVTSDADGTLPIANLGQSVNGAGLYCDGSINTFGGSPGTWAGTIDTGDVVRMRFTIATATLEAAINGGSWFTVQAGISMGAGGAWRAGIYGNNGATHYIGATFNFGASPFVYSVPAGFDAGWLQD